MSEEFLDRLLATPLMFGGALSPDGENLAFLCRGQFTPVTKLYVASTDGKSAPRALLEDIEGWDCDDYAWSADSTHLIVAQSENGNELRRLSWVEVLSGTHRVILQPEADIFLFGGSLHPNNRWIVYSSNRDPDTKRATEQGVVYRHDMISGERKALVKLSRPSIELAPTISPGGEQILYGRSDLDPSGLQLWVMDIDGSNDRELINFGAKIKASGIWLRGGKGAHILCLVETPTHRRLGLCDTGNGQIEWLIDDPKRDIVSVSWPKASPMPIVAEYKMGRLHASLFDPVTQKETAVRKTGYSLSVLGQTDRKGWVVGAYHSCLPDQYRLAEIENDQVSLGEILSLNPDVKGGIPSDELMPVEDFLWRSVDGLEIHAWLHRAKGKAKGTILYIHGGPTYHTEDEFSVQVQFLVHNGFHVVQPNYRGSTGFGLPFQLAIKKEGWGGREQEDIRTCAEALIKAGIAQRNKIGITGVSYGGYSSWWAITHFPVDLIAAAIPICGMTDLVVDYEGTRPDLRGYCEEMMGGSPAQVPEKYRERSPINNIHRIKGRLLIVQGMTDPNVTPKNMFAVQKELDQNRIPYEVMAFEDEGHGIAKPANRRKLFLKMVDFFSRAFAA